MKTSPQRTVGRLLVPVAAALVTLTLALVVSSLQNDRRDDAARSAAVRRAGAEAVALQRQLDRSLGAAIALAAHVQLNQGRIDGFVEFADQMRGIVPGITNLQLAPDGVVQHIHPLPGNEAAIGHQLLVDRERSTEAFVAVETRALTVAGPFDLVQGGTALVGRQPIFLPGAGNVDGLDPDFWGFATVLINLDDFFGASRISELVDDGYDYEISRFNRDLDGFESFRWTGDLVDPVAVEVSVANGTWRLELARSSNWSGSGWDFLQLVVASLASVTALVAAHRFLRRDERLVAAVDERTTALRLANEDLRLARDAAERASAAKTTFLSNVSHELRTPMNAIIGFSELIDAEQLDPADREALDQIRSAGAHLLGLINQVLDVAAIEHGRLGLELEPVDLASVGREVAELLSPLADEHGVHLDVEGDDAVALADRSRMFQVITNLTANAVRFTPRGGRVRLVTTSDGDRCRCTVADDGVGIPEGDLEHIFEPFDRGGADPAVEGSGVGLAIVDQLVRAMDGSVTVESEVGRGSSFTVVLPAGHTSVVPVRSGD